MDRATRNFKRLHAMAIIAFALGAMGLPSTSWAAIFTGTGTGTGGQPISAEAVFDFVSHDFGAGEVDAVQITLTNTASTTSYRGNLLTGIFFSVYGVGALPTDAAGFDGQAATVRTTNTTSISKVDIAPAINGTTTDATYQLSNGPFGTANSGVSYSAYAAGIATVGYGLTGFSGAATDGDTYGIAAAGSNLTLDGIPSALPVIDTSAVFWILKPQAWTLFEQITNLRFAYGSLPDNKIDVTITNAIPAPTSLLIWSGLLGVGMVVTGIRFRKAMA